MGKRQMSVGEPIKQSTTFLVSFTQSFNSARNWLKQLLHEDGKSMGMNFEFGENPFLGKINFDFWSKKAPKNAYPFAHTPTFFIFSHAGKDWELFLNSMIWVAVCFLHDFFFTILGPGRFPPSLEIQVGLSLSIGWKFVVCEF